MLKASIPARFNIPFANGAGGGFVRPIPQASQIGIQGGAASLTDGFVPLNFQPVASGGIPPFGEDFNGILNQISAWSQWFEAGGPIVWDSTFASGASGGYPQGAIVQSNIVPGNFWLSTADSNTNNPDALSPTGWVQLPSMVLTGTPVASLSSTVPTGYVPANGQTVGNASSNATGRANPDTQLIYRFVWLNFSNTACPLLNSSGSPVSRGANPDADFNANNQLTLPDARGRGLIGVDTMGGGTTTRLSGVPVTQGNTTSPGSVIGENLHTLTSTEVPATAVSAVGGSTTGGMNASDPHTHPYNTVTTGAGTIGGGGAFGGPQAATTTATSVAHAHAFNVTVNGNVAGGGGAHNNVSLDLTVFWNLKL